MLGVILNEATLREIGAPRMTDLIEEHFSGCYDTRARVLEALASVVVRLQEDNVSELQAVRYLEEEMTKYYLSSYWYPAGEEAGSRQNGCIVAFDTSDQPSRTSFNSGRTQAASDSVMWEGFGYFYASPQSLTSNGIVAWGDIGCTVYMGNDPVIRSAVRAAWERNQAVLSRLSNMSAPTTLDVFLLNADESDKRGLTNIAWSASQNGYNIGHCFPTTRVNSLNDRRVHELASQRLYIDGATELPLSGAPWSYEARDHSDKYPHGAVQFHEVVTYGEDGLARLPSYEQLFVAAGMDWVTV